MLVAILGVHTYNNNNIFKTLSFHVVSILYDIYTVCLCNKSTRIRIRVDRCVCFFESFFHFHSIPACIRVWVEWKKLRVCAVLKVESVRYVRTL